jgi:HK97 family phage major capsid protein
MTIAVTHSVIEELTNVISELETLTSKPSLNKRDEARHAFLLSKVSLLKSGVSVGELRRYEEDRLLAQAGGPRLPDPHRRGHLDEESETEWRKFALGEEFRATFRPPDKELRANLAGTESITYTQGAAGGYFTRPRMHEDSFESMKQYDQLFEDWASNIIETADGSGMQFPAWDDVNNQSVQVGESTQSNEVDVANFGTTQLQAWAFRSKKVLVSLELLQDSNFPIGQILERVFAMRHARGVGAAMATGTGVNSPAGLITAALAAGASVTVASGSSQNTGGSETGATSVGTTDIGKLYAALNPIYRPGAVFAMNDSVLQYLAQLVDKNGRPVIDFGIGPARDNQGPTIWSHPVAICPSFPALGNTHNTVVFYNPNYFLQRRVPSSMYVRRFWEAPGLVENGLVAFESWLRVDSALVAPNPNFVPAAVLQNHS